MQRDPIDLKANAQARLAAGERPNLMTVYKRFEQVVALALSLIIATVIVIALIQLCKRILPLIVGGALDPLEHDVFQSLFDAIFTVLIAMEFKHSIIRAALRRDSVVQVRTVILIALLAISRKFVILDSTATPASTIAALAAVTVALGVVFWLLKDWNSEPPEDLELGRPAKK
jgi:uncharacterized membrane protein (DUF373 family)